MKKQNLEPKLEPKLEPLKYYKLYSYSNSSISSINNSIRVISNFKYYINNIIPCFYTL